MEISKMHSKLIKVKSIEDISLISVEVNSYKYSKDIAAFNYDENHQILKQLFPAVLNEILISNILYVAALIELLGSTYINKAIILNNNNFMIEHNKFSYDINKYINHQDHTGSTYTIVMRKAAKIIEYKYKFVPDIKVQDVNISAAAAAAGVKVQDVNFITKSIL